MPYLIAAAFILIGGALSFGMAGRKLKRRKRRKKIPASGTPDSGAGESGTST